MTYAMILCSVCHLADFLLFTDAENLQNAKLSMEQLPKERRGR